MNGTTGPPMRLRWTLLYFTVLLLAVTIVFTLSLMFTDDGLAFAWKPWPIW